MSAAVSGTRRARDSRGRCARPGYACYPVLPAALIGRLAVDRRWQGRQLGAALLYDAIARAIRADAAVFALLVDAKDEAARFYRHHGFEAFAGRAKRLFLPVATARRVVEG
jgi:predicted N-acetyltransferase YhbS